MVSSSFFFFFFFFENNKEQCLFCSSNKTMAVLYFLWKLFDLIPFLFFFFFFLWILWICHFSSKWIACCGILESKYYVTPKTNHTLRQTWRDTCHELSIKPVTRILTSHRSLPLGHFLSIRVHHCPSTLTCAPPPNMSTRLSTQITLSKLI